MRPSFHPRLVNSPFDDPALFIPFLHENRAIMFDLGDTHPLSARDMLKLTHIFVSHTHMDHFIGFDRLLRLLLGREKELFLYGPRGFLENMAGKLAGYTWNLVEHYKYQFSLHVTEVHPDHTRSRRYHCRMQFRPDGPVVEKPFSGTLLTEPALAISSAILDHKIDSLGFCLSERFHINILKSGLDGLNLPVGPWIRRFKDTLYNGMDPATPFEISLETREESKRVYRLGELADQVALITPGQKLAYITDAAGISANIEKILALVENADHLFIEASFLDRDKELAAETHHLTARQAGRIAREAGVRQCTLFHFSPRYTGSHQLLEQEAARAAGPDIVLNSWELAE